MTLKTPKIMGIVNVTPDSFSDGGRFNSVDLAVDHALRMVDEGADILDIGGESTRPGAEPVAMNDELGRILPVIEKLSGKTSARLSVDTRKPGVARIAVDAGVHIWNDVSALTFAEDSIDVAASLDCDLILMHAQGDPKTMQDEPFYHDVVAEVKRFLSERADACVAAGIARRRLTIDPGIGFGKRLEDNLLLINNLGAFDDLRPLLIGASRKRFIASCDRDGPAADRLGGSLAAALMAAEYADIIRVHDVAATRQALNVRAAIISAIP